MMNNPPSNQSSNSNGTRRDFIKTSSVVAAGTLAGSLNIANYAHAAGNDQLKIALIGCGGRGTSAVRQALGTNGDVKLVAMSDAFEDRMGRCHSGLARDKKYKARVDVPQERMFAGFDGYKKIMEMGDVDVVLLATPPGFRPIHFEAAIKAGKHVFMEKPVAVDAPGIRKVLESAKEAKKKKLCVGVGLQRHHQKPYIETIKRLKDGMIGDIVCTRVYWNGGGVWVRPRKAEQTEMQYQMRNWYYFNWLCGDHISEQHIHNIDVSNWLIGDYPVSAQGMGGRQVRTGKDHGEIFDHHCVEYTYANGAKMFSQCRHIRGCWNSVSEHAHGTKGHADISGSSIKSGSDQWKFRGPSKNPYQVEHDDLFAAIRSGADYNEAENGAKSTMTSILGRMATYSGQYIKWDDAINSKIDLSPKSYKWDAEPPVLPDENGYYPIAVPGKTKTV